MCTLLSACTYIGRSSSLQATHFCPSRYPTALRYSSSALTVENDQDTVLNLYLGLRLGAYQSLLAFNTLSPTSSLHVLTTLSPGHHPIPQSFSMPQTANVVAPSPHRCSTHTSLPMQKLKTSVSRSRARTLAVYCNHFDTYFDPRPGDTVSNFSPQSPRDV